MRFRARQKYSKKLFFNSAKSRLFFGASLAKPEEDASIHACSLLGGAMPVGTPIPNCLGGT